MLSVSVVVVMVVHVERVLDDSAKAGAEKVLETGDWTDSCEARRSCLCRASGASDGAIDM